MTHCVEMRLELLDEVVLSRRTATVGDHQSLDFIPGSVLLGWAAARLYKQLASEEAYLVFHSGRVRFGNGLPLSDAGEAARPTPLCWHEDKGGDAALKDGRLRSDKMFNLIHSKPEGLKQPRQLREGYVTASGAVVKPLKAHRMKTAINDETGTAKESQLFGFESLMRGQRFVTKIEADASVSADLFERVVQCFGESIRIGRSRSAQYGRVKVNVQPRAASPEYIPAGEKSVSLWLQSDMALRDANGMPLLVPEDSAMLGLPSGKLIIEKSFVRFRSYAPYNAHYRCHEMERQVIVAGSVLHYELDAPLAAEHIAMLQGGLGNYREAGLGRVCVNQEWLQQAQPVFGSAPESKQATERVAPVEPLIALLQKRAGQDAGQKQAKVWAEKICVELKAIYRSAHRYNGLRGADPIGPNRSQWRRVQDEVQREGWQTRLFDAEDGVCKSKDEDWGREYDAGKSFAGWLQGVVKSNAGQPDLALRLQWLARLAETLSEPEKSGGRND